MATPDNAVQDAPATPEKQKLNLQVKIDKVGTCKRHVTVTVPREEIDRYFHEAFDEFVPKAEVPGFRPGRAPRKLVEKSFREQMTNQVKGSLLMDSVSQVADSAEFSAISEPEFDYEAVDLPSDGPLTFEFNIEVRPEFDIPEWKGLKLSRQVHEYTDAEVSDKLRQLLAKRYAERVTQDAAIATGDSCVANLVFKDGERVLSEALNQTLVVKPILSFNDGNLENFQDLVLGKRAGDRVTGQVKVSEGAEEESLRGKAVTIEIEITAVTHVQLPEMTPAFLEQIGGFADEAELRDAVRSELERQLEYSQQRSIRQQITTSLIKDANWELPTDLLRRQFRREVDRLVLELRASGFQDDDIRRYENQIRQNSLSATAASLKEHFIFERLAEEHKIDADERDFEMEIRAIAAQQQESARKVRARLEKRGQMDALRNQIIERKVVELITSHAEISDVPFTPGTNDTEAIDHPVCGTRTDAPIPEAKYGGDAQVLPGQGDKQ